MVPSSSPPTFSVKPNRVDLAERRPPDLPAGFGAEELPVPALMEGAEIVLAGVVGAKEDVGDGVESESKSVVSVISVGVGVVSAMGAESS